MVRKNSSILWDMFEKTTDKKARCNFCGDIYCYKSTTGNLKCHLRIKHPNVFRQVVANQHDPLKLPPTSRDTRATSSSPVAGFSQVSSNFTLNGQLWDIFEKADNEDKKAWCSLCGELYSYKATTGNLSTHLKRKHPDEYQQLADGDALDSKPAVKNHSDGTVQNNSPKFDPDLLRVRSGTKKISLWDMFEKAENEDKKAWCKFCGELYSYKATTNNLKSHLKKMHMDEYQQLAEGDDAPLEPPPELPITISFIPSSLPVIDSVVSLVSSSDALNNPPNVTNNSNKSEIDADLLRVFTDSFLPISLVEEQAFKKFASWIPGYTLPSRKTISNEMIPKLYESTREAIKQEFSGTQVQSVCLTGDLWTSEINQSFIAITGHYVKDDLTVKTILLDSKSFVKSANLSDIMLETAVEWGIAEKINLVVTNNANITEAIRDLGWEHFDCYAHTLNSIVEDALKSVGPVVNNIKTIVRHFQMSSDAQNKLFDEQTQENPASSPKRLKQEVPKRWNSTLYMLQRFVKLESSVRATLTTQDNLPNISDEEWRYCADLCVILKPFEEALSSINGYMTASSVIVMTSCLVTSCDKLLADDFSPAAKVTILTLQNSLRTKFAGVEESDIFSVCTFLDPRYKMVGFDNSSDAQNARERVLDLLVEMISGEIDLNASQPPVVNSEMSPWLALLQDKLNQSQTVATPLSKAIQEVDKFLNEDMLPVFRSKGCWNCPGEWWQARKSVYPYLSRLFKKYGNIMATSASCERLVSKTGQIISDRRTRLPCSQVEQLVFLNMNLKK